MKWGWALFGGLLGGGVVVGILAVRKQRALELQAAQMRTSLQTQGRQLEAYLASKGGGMEAELQAIGREVVEDVGTYHLATSWGITPGFARQLQAAGSRIGA